MFTHSVERDINAACNIFRFGKQALAKRQRGFLESQCGLPEELAAIFGQTTDMELTSVSSSVFRLGHQTPVVGIPVLTAQAAARPQEVPVGYAEGGEDVKPRIKV